MNNLSSSVPLKMYHATSECVIQTFVVIDNCKGKGAGYKKKPQQCRTRRLPARTKTKTNACTFYLNGNCRRGENCKFSHIEQPPPTESQPSSDRQICRFWKKGICKHGDNGYSCPFLHKGPSHKDPSIAANQSSNAFDDYKNWRDLLPREVATKIFLLEKPKQIKKFLDNYNHDWVQFMDYNVFIEFGLNDFQAKVALEKVKKIVEADKASALVSTPGDANATAEPPKTSSWGDRY